MFRFFSVMVIIIAPCWPANAQTDIFSKTAYELTAICWYPTVEKLCNFRVTDEQRAALASVREKVLRESVDGEELTANVLCAAFLKDIKDNAVRVCTPQAKDAFVEGLDKIVEGEKAASR